MDDGKAANPEEIHAVIGYVVASLLEAGKPMHMHEIAALLKMQAERASDVRVKEHCLQALRLIADKMN